MPNGDGGISSHGAFLKMLGNFPVRALGTLCLPSMLDGYLCGVLIIAEDEN
jgi:hypothetical protein